MKKTLDIIKETINRNLAPIKGPRGLGGNRYKQRANELNNGKQKRRIVGSYTEEATKIVKQKLKADGNNSSEIINTKPELTTFN
jgi:hypothetical protein